MWPYEKSMQLWTMYATTLLYEKMTKIKVISLDEFYNFVVDGFFIWNYLVSKNSVHNVHILKFKFWIVQTKSNEEMIQIKVVDLDGFDNFNVDNFFIWNHFLYQFFFEISHTLKFKFRIGKRIHMERTKTKVLYLFLNHVIILNGIFSYDAIMIISV